MSLAGKSKTARRKNGHELKQFRAVLFLQRGFRRRDAFPAGKAIASAVR
jgi:hypothetical protein